MDGLIKTLLDLNAIVKDQAALEGALADVAARFGFSGFCYISLRPGNYHVFSNLHAEWQERYFRLALSRSDPRIRRARTEKRAFVWSGGTNSKQLPSDHRRFYTHAASYDIRSGISIPVPISNGAIAMLTFASPEPVQTREWKIDPIAATSAAAQLHALVEHLRVTPSMAERIHLSPKEASYVRWLELGKTVEDTADIERVKYNTVRVALAEVRRRYDLCNNTQLVALAIRRKLI